MRISNFISQQCFILLVYFFSLPPFNLSLFVFFLSSLSVNFFSLSSLSFSSPVTPSSMPDKSSSSKPPRQVSLLPFLFFFLPMFVERVWVLECWLFASVYLNNVFFMNKSCVILQESTEISPSWWGAQMVINWRVMIFGLVRFLYKKKAIKLNF